MCFVGYLLEGPRAKMARSLKTVALFSLFRWLPIKQTNSHRLLQSGPKVGMKIRHKSYGILTILGVEKRIDKTIITVKDTNGEISTKTWEVLVDKKQINIV